MDKTKYFDAQGRICCPNHKVPLQSKSAGIGQCPESGVFFAYDEQKGLRQIKTKIVNGEMVTEESEVIDENS